MADDDDDDESATAIFSRSVVSDLVSGRQTLFCCLSCGVPFALSNDAYIYRDEPIQEFIRFVHGVRKQVSALSLLLQFLQLCCVQWARLTL